MVFYVVALTTSHLATMVKPRSEAGRSQVSRTALVGANRLRDETLKSVHSSATYIGCTGGRNAQHQLQKKRKLSVLPV
jgi:hypothetical protein